MRHILLSLFAAALLFPPVSHAVTLHEDELGRLTNGDEVYQARNPPKKGQEKRPVPEIDQYDHMGVTPLQRAVLYRKPDEVRALLRKKANPNIVSAEDTTALQMAVKSNQVEMVRLLLSSKASPNLRDTLSLAQSPEMTKLLKAHGAVPGKKTEKKERHIMVMGDGEAKVIHQTLDQHAKHNQPIPTLAQAVMLDKDLKYLEGMLEKGHDINGEDPVFGTALYQFFMQKRAGPVGLFLLEKGADPNLVSRMNKPLFMAVGRGDLDIISLMIKKGADVSATGNSGESVLCMAAVKGAPDMMRLFLDAGVKVDSTDKDGQTALYYVLRRTPKAVDVARLLLGNGASTTVAPQKPALGVVNWSRDNVDMMLLLLEHKATPVTDNDGRTLVVFATGIGSMPLLEAAIRAGASVNQKDKRGTSALEKAVGRSRGDMVRVLLAAGAPVNGSVGEAGKTFVDSYGKLHQGTDDLLATAVSIGDIDVITILIEAGVNLDTRANSFEQPTPLHIAVQKKRKDLLDLLLAAGASPNSLNRYGRTPLYSAARNGGVQMVQSLLAAGADPNIADEDGETPMNEALRRKNKEIADLLSRSGGRAGVRKER